MGKGIEDWTDKDYAQAAIDMLPETVEEIAEFLRAQGIKRGERFSGLRCPIARWIARWTDKSRPVGPTGLVFVDDNFIGSPVTREFVIAYDRGDISL